LHHRIHLFLVIKALGT